MRLSCVRANKRTGVAAGRSTQALAVNVALAHLVRANTRRNPGAISMRMGCMKQQLTPTVGPCDQEVVDLAALHSWQGRPSCAAVSPSLKHMLSMKQVPLWSVVSAGVAPQVSMHLM